MGLQQFVLPYLDLYSIAVLASLLNLSRLLGSLDFSDQSNVLQRLFPVSDQSVGGNNTKVTAVH
jgi:hypothetical protein